MDPNYNPYAQAQYGSMNGAFSVPQPPVYSQPVWRPQYVPQNQPAYFQNTNNQPRSMFGKVVSNENEILPNDVPMDGSTSFFPLSDGSMIFAKTWNSDGTIRTIRYSPIKESVEADKKPSEFEVIIQRLDKIETKLNNSFNGRNGKRFDKPKEEGSENGN